LLSGYIILLLIKYIDGEVLTRGLIVKKFLVAASAFVFSCSAALAADLSPAPVEPVAPVASVFSWTGFYVGAQAGYGWSDTDYRFNGPVPNGTFHPDGFVGGAHAGYNYQFETPVVVGLEGDIEYSDIKADFNNPFGGFSGGNAKLRWQGSIRARFGYAIDRFLPYVTGGVSFGDFRFAGGPGIGSGFTPALVSWSKTMTGWTIGAGLEYAVTDNWTVRAEYRYTDYGDTTGSLAPAYPGTTERMKVQVQSIRAGVSYKF
jgi:outer membrane immunogenic protein